MSARDAAGYVSFYWGGAMIGRFLGAPLLRRIKAGYVLAVCATAAAALVTTSMMTGGHTAMWTILAVGFFNSIMFPTIFSLGVAELGPLTGNGSGLLNMAIVGGAVLPLIQGAIADRFGLHHAFVLPVICYLYIFFFALSGSKPNSERHGECTARHRGGRCERYKKQSLGGRPMLLAGDIGGTKTALGVFSGEQGPHKAGVESEFHSADYGSLESIVKEFLAKTGLINNNREPGLLVISTDKPNCIKFRPVISRGALPSRSVILYFTDGFKPLRRRTWMGAIHFFAAESLDSPRPVLAVELPGDPIAIRML